MLLTIVGITGLIFKRRLNQAHRPRQAQEDFSRRLIDSQEQERKRIAAELHDGLGQNLLVIKNRVLLGLNPPADYSQALEQLGQISTTAADAISEVRQIAHNLRPYRLTGWG